MFESELLRIGKDTFDLSEMFVVRHVYEEKAEKYIRMHGTINFSGGGFFHDVIHVLDSFGMVPDEMYTGLKMGEKNYIHTEMDEVLKGYMDEVILNKDKEISPVWKDGFKGLLDSYLGELPLGFNYENMNVNPVEFASWLNLDPEDYIEIT
jgi:bleomycin hydrolase